MYCSNIRVSSSTFCTLRGPSMDLPCRPVVFVTFDQRFLFFFFFEFSWFVVFVVSVLFATNYSFPILLFFRYRRHVCGVEFIFRVLGTLVKLSSACVPSSISKSTTSTTSVKINHHTFSPINYNSFSIILMNLV